MSPYDQFQNDLPFRVLRYEWQSRYGQGPDSGLLPLKDPEYTARIRGYKRSVGSIDEPSTLPDDEDETVAAERER